MDFAPSLLPPFRRGFRRTPGDTADGTGPIARTSEARRYGPLTSAGHDAARARRAGGVGPGRRRTRLSCNNPITASTDERSLVSSPSSAWHKWAFLATDVISDTEPVAPVLVDRTAQSVRGRARESYAAYLRDATLVWRPANACQNWQASSKGGCHAGRIPDFPVTRSHPPASWPSAANSSICRTYRKTAGEESRRRSPVANRWMRP